MSYSGSVDYFSHYDNKSFNKYESHDRDRDRGRNDRDRDRDRERDRNRDRDRDYYDNDRSNHFTSSNNINDNNNSNNNSNNNGNINNNSNNVRLSTYGSNYENDRYTRRPYEEPRTGSARNIGIDDFGTRIHQSRSRSPYENPAISPDKRRQEKPIIQDRQIGHSGLNEQNGQIGQIGQVGGNIFDCQQPQQHYKDWNSDSVQKEMENSNTNTNTNTNMITPRNVHDSPHIPGNILPQNPLLSFPSSASHSHPIRPINIAPGLPDGSNVIVATTPSVLTSTSTLTSTSAQSQIPIIIPLPPSTFHLLPPPPPPTVTPSPPLSLPIPVCVLKPPQPVEPPQPAIPRTHTHF